MARFHNDTSQNAAKRIQAVSRMKLRYGWTAPRIQQELAQRIELHNPKKQQPWSLATIKLDLKHLVEEWKAEATKNWDEHMSQQLHQIREARSAAWAQKEVNTVLRSLEQEAKLLGLNAPEKHTQTDITGKQERQPIIVLGGTKEEFRQTLHLMAEDTANGHHAEVSG